MGATMVGKVLSRAAIGALLGMIMGVTVVISISFAHGGGTLVLPTRLVAMTGSEAGALLAQMLISGVYGAIPFAGTVLYELDSWGMLKQAVVHYATYTVAFVVIGIAAGWIDPIPADIGVVVGIFAICHAIIWLIMYAKYKSEVGQLNELLVEAK